MTERPRGHEIRVWYRLPGDAADRPQTVSVTDERTAGEAAPGPGTLAALARGPASVPPVSRAPAGPAPGPGAERNAGGTSSA
jgi:hypothetical protein